MARAKAEWLYGLASVRAALLSARRPWFDSLWVHGADGSGSVAALAAARGVRVEEHALWEMNRQARDRPHQGVLLAAAPVPTRPVVALGAVARTASGRYDILRYKGAWHQYTVRDPAQAEIPFERAGGAAAPLWLALDQVVDPQNLGAILRTAAFFGVDGVVVCARNSAPLSPTVSRASAGALEWMPVYTAHNLMRFLELSRAAGWTVAGTSVTNAASVPAHTYAFSPTPHVIVLGNEGVGLRPLVERVCDRLVFIQGHAAAANNPDLGVDSLNVAAATAVLVHQWHSGMHSTVNPPAS